MLVRHYSSLPIEQGTIEESYRIVKRVRERLKSIYSAKNPRWYDEVRHVNVLSIEPEYHALWGGIGASIDYWIHRLLARIVQVSEGHVQDLVILDLGAGSTGHNNDIEGSPSNRGSLSIWNPWLCRALHEFGAEVIAVDTGLLTDLEPYEHHGGVDIMHDDLQALVKRNDIDIVHSHALLSSFQMRETHGRDESFFDFYRRFAAVIFPQLEKMVKRGGVYILDDNPLPA